MSHTTLNPIEPLTVKEKRAWYYYDWALGSVSSVSTVFVLPLLMDYVAFHAGSGYDKPILKPGDPAAMMPDFKALDSGWFKPGTCVDGQPELPLSDQDYYPRCVLPWGDGYIRSTSWTLNGISISVGVQAFFYISLGALADHGNLRKKLMMLFTWLGVLCCLLLAIPFPKELYWLPAILSIGVSLCLGSASVFYNSYLPIITEATPELIEYKKIESDSIKIEEKAESISNYYSIYASGLGMLGGAIAALLGAGLIAFLKSPLSYYVNMALSGVWWAVFSIYTAKYLKNRQGKPPLPKGTNSFIYSWKNFFNTLTHIRSIPRTYIYLICWILFADAYSTLVQVAVLFAQVELKADRITIALLVILSPLFAFVGNHLFLFIQRKVHARAKTMLQVCLFGYILISIYGILGLTSLPVGFKPVNMLLLNDKCVLNTNSEGQQYYDGEGCKKIAWELYVFAVFHGLLLGPLNSFSRVIFSELIPTGSESEFFSFYAITDKGTSWIGPLIVGALNNGGGTLRYSFLYFLISFAVPIPILYFLNLHKGKEDAIKFAKLNEVEK
ncbi:Autophagy protein 22 [Lobulomyces angularis]|nr:Autophagy protein 22 [Lobulomyces angularis]